MAEIIKININDKEGDFNIPESINNFLCKYKKNTKETFKLVFINEEKVDVTEKWKDKKSFKIIEQTIQKIMDTIKEFQNEVKVNMEELEAKYNSLIQE